MMKKGSVMRRIFALVACCFVCAAAFGQMPHLRVAVIPESPLPGEPVSVGVVGETGANLRAVLVNKQGRLAKAVFFTLKPREILYGNLVKAALLAVPSTTRPGTAFIRIENGDSLIKEIAITIGSRDFASEVIPLDTKNTEIRTVPSREKTDQANHLWAILSRTGTEAYSLSAFAPPTTATRRTSFYGDRRVYRYSNGAQDTAIHAGIDYGVPTGTQVLACSEGRVALAEFRIATGNSVIIEHLPGVYSIYYHMSALAVAEGAMVKTGDLLGESGATGLATGPHLHWEIRISGENTDPDACVARPIFDRDALLRELSGSGGISK